jgi:DNA-binding transcriptional ArsR family regulator
MGTDTVTTELGSALFGKARRAVLGLLYARPDEAFYLRQITREVQAGQGAVQRELKRLVDAGLLTREARGREVHYRANRACPIFAELHGLVLKTVGLADVLRGVLLPFQTDITLAAVYGSQAAGTATLGSDVDLLVVGTVEELALHKAVAEAETQLARAVNYTLLTPREFTRRRRERGGFVARILAGPLIPLLGSPDGT